MQWTEIRRQYPNSFILPGDPVSVIYALPGTPEDFIVEDVPFMGLLR